MFVHPQFDPVAFEIGPVAVRWYGLMYLVAFILFAVLGKLRARQNLLTGWHPRDVDDMLFYGVFGVDPRRPSWLRAVLQAALLPRASARDPSGLAGRDELPRRLPRRAHRAVALCAATRQALARRHRFRRTAGAARACRRPARQFHQRRALGPRHRRCHGRMVFPQAGPRAATSVAALRIRRSKACCCSSCCGSTRDDAGRWARCRDCS